MTRHVLAWVVLLLLFPLVLEAAPPQPSMGGLIAVGAHSATATWTDPGGGATNYTLAADLNSEISASPSPLTFTSFTTATLTGLTPNTTTYFFVRSCDNGGSCSIYFLIGSSVTMAVTPGLSVLSIGATAVTLALLPADNPPGTVTHVEASTDGGTTFAEAAAGPSLTVSVGGLATGVRHVFRAWAENYAGTPTGFSNTVSATPHFSALDEARLFPFPFRPGAGHTALTMDQLPSQSTVEVRSLAGDLVQSLRADDAGRVQWDVRNSAGASVASGIYAVHIDGAGRRRVLTLVIQK